MPVLPPPKRSNRRVKFKDAAQFDVVRGVERARVWPAPKLSNQTPQQLAQQEWFRQANWAFKYMDGRIQALIRQAVHLTGLYPRDLFTIMAANRLVGVKTPDGRILYPMPARQDVSESLDVLGQQAGFILVRGGQFWEVKDSRETAVAGFKGGCRATLNAPLSQNWTAGAYVNWKGPNLFDTGPYHDPAVNPSRITPLAEDTYVEFTAGLRMSSMAANSILRAEIHINGTPRGAQGAPAGSSGVAQLQLSTGPWLLENPGTDYAQVWCWVEGDTSSQLDQSVRTWFGYQRLAF